MRLRSLISDTVIIIEKLKQKLYTAQKEKDAFMLSVLRYLLAGVKNREIEIRVLHREMNDSDVMGVINSQILQRKDSIENYKMAKRQDLVDKESAELKILEDLLLEFGK